VTLTTYERMRTNLKALSFQVPKPSPSKLENFSLSNLSFQSLSPKRL